jgi:hypothetical protein
MKALSCALLFVLALCAPVLVPPQAHAAATLLSQGRPALASTSEGAGTPASAAVDGDQNTRWSSEWTDPQWLRVDLGSTQQISQVVLQWEAAYATSFEIQVSDDGVNNWHDIYSTTAGTGGRQTLSVSGAGRYVRMYGTKRANGYGYSLWEFQVYGGADQPGGPQWNPVWTDNFPGAAGSAPNAANWITATGPNPSSGEVETNTAANVALDGNGHVNLTALNNNGNWTSGRIESQRTDFAAPAGGQLMITASIKQPNVANALGYWPAFRAYGSAYRGNPGLWPAVGETDIMEGVNGRAQSSETLHCGTVPGGNCGEYNGMTSGLGTCGDCQTAYHTYAEVIDRTLSDEQIRFTIDGQQVWQVRESQVGVSTWQAAVDHGFYLVFDLAIGGGYPNTVCGCTSPSPQTSSGGVLSIGSVGVYTSTGTTPPPLTTPPVPNGGTVVKVTGGQGNWGLSVNGSPYYIKGVTFGPQSATAEAHMQDLKELGVNTVRTWGTDASSQPLLDRAAAVNIKVINGFWLNQGTDFVNDTAYEDSTLAAIVQQVNAYKNHPGVLMWDVGNEVLLTLQNTYSGAQLEAERNAYARYVERVAQAIHAADPNHPVTSTDAWTGAWPYYKANTPSLDLYAVNTYGAACNVKQDWINGGYTKPYIVTESGEAGEWEVPNDANGVPTEPSDQQKVAGYASAWNCIQGHAGVSLGATLFNYGNENDFGGIWFNLEPGGWKFPTYYQVAQNYGGSPATPAGPVITSMSVPQNVNAGKQFAVSVNVTGSVRYNLMYASKYVDNNTTLRYAAFTQTGANSFSVTAPNQLGVWKVYVYAYDGHGNVAVETKSVNVTVPPVNGTNVARDKPTTASSYQATGNGAPYPASNAVDGSTTTRWATDWSDPQWIQVDLGQATAIHHIQLVWESAYGKAYTIQVSPDGNSNWTTIHATTTGAGGVEDFDVSGSGRFVRLTGTQRGTAYGYSLFEFGIYQ